MTGRWRKKPGGANLSMTQGVVFVGEAFYPGAPPAFTIPIHFALVFFPSVPFDHFAHRVGDNFVHIYYNAFHCYSFCRAALAGGLELLFQEAGGENFPC